MTKNTIGCGEPTTLLLICITVLNVGVLKFREGFFACRRIGPAKEEARARKASQHRREVPPLASWKAARTCSDEYARSPQ